MSPEPVELSGLYLEDSYFLGLSVSGRTIRLQALFALTGDHVDYRSPLSDEQHCYREGTITLDGAVVENWLGKKPMLLTDPDGSFDLGSIEILKHHGGYQVITEWFDLACRADALSVVLDENPAGA